MLPLTAELEAFAAPVQLTVALVALLDDQVSVEEPPLFTEVGDK